MQPKWKTCDFKKLHRRPKGLHAYMSCILQKNPISNKKVCVMQQQQLQEDAISYKSIVSHTCLLHSMPRVQNKSGKTSENVFACVVQGTGYKRRQM